MAESNEFIREVDEEYRRDRILQIWKRYSAVIVGLAVLVVLGAGGWRYYQASQRNQAEAAGARYEDAMRAARDGKGEEAERTLEALAKEAPDGYRALARLRLAAEKGRQNAEEGAKAFEALGTDASVPGPLQELARLRAVLLRMDSAEPGSLQQPLERLASPTGPWRHTAREMLGLLALKRGDTDGASRWFDQIAADREAPQALRSRLEIYSALAAGGPVQTTQ